MIGARVIKTSLAVSLSILIARSCKLDTPQFAGIVSVLAVQPSIYRTFRHGLQQTASALMGAALGAWVLFVAGNSWLVMGGVALLLMALHVRIGWTNSLLVAVVIAINTMGTSRLTFAESAFNQMALVAIGMGIGTLVNLLHKPAHEARAEVAAVQSERMLRALLHYICLDLQDRRVTPYDPVMKGQISQVRAYIEKGKDISRLIREDKRFHTAGRDPLAMFHSFESMAERIRDIVKELQKIDLQKIGRAHGELQFANKAIRVVIRLQERLVAGRSAGLGTVQRALEARKNGIWSQRTEQTADADFASALCFYNLYHHLLEYLRELEAFRASCGGEGIGAVKYPNANSRVVPFMDPDKSNALVKLTSDFLKI
ncbi:FUSC family protein [Effusibacillus pohliae]|uniref:FUSC family protein n=1 Tax=Effusibacillus pohliae TaxID=232270 RepID=UPI00037A0A16|nr:aromatic acid exporter family protein [Effusibacillus pohliae]